MAIDRKPTVLLVHGSWHRPCHYERLIRQLKQLGFEVVCPALPSIGKDRLGKGWHDDVLRIQETALQLFAKKKQVVLLAHSYGGIPAAAATEGLTRSERAAAGLPGGFCHVIYMSAFALPAREMSLLQSVGGSFPSWVNHGETYGQSKVSQAEVSSLSACRVKRNALYAFGSKWLTAYLRIDQHISIQRLSKCCTMTFRTRR